MTPLTGEPNGLPAVSVGVIRPKVVTGETTLLTKEVTVGTPPVGAGTLPLGAPLGPGLELIPDG